MAKELAKLTEKETLFIEELFNNGGKLAPAAEAAGYHPAYCYKLRDNLSKAIIEAAEQYLAIHALKASKRIVDTIDAEMPNPIQLQAAQALLDRVGIIKKSNEEAIVPIVKANIFILPEKRPLEITEYTEVE